MLAAPYLLEHTIAVRGIFCDLGGLPFRLLDAVLRLIDIDVFGGDSLLDEHLHEVLGDLEEPVGGRIDPLFVVLPYPDLPSLHGGDQRRMIDKHPDVPVGDAGDHEVSLTVVDHLLRRDDPAEELPAPPVAIFSHQPSSSSPDSSET